ncbi:hypothetical protein [Flexithrix dorotheae]|uniref:hypothetical protein n=1 Tax=Flexithrix dorotheae TaxID=70993 RepID=UPI00037BF73A|nr:hypothetical protein [Flexithrix dorotheae]
MKTREIDKGLIEIIEIKNQLNGIVYHDQKYDEIEDHLHEIEDNFLEKHGFELERILKKVHVAICPDVDLLSPLSYIAHEYKKVGENETGPIYDIKHDQGVYVEVDSYQKKPTKLVIVPNPLRVILNIDGHTREEVWSVNM